VKKHILFSQQLNHCMTIEGFNNCLAKNSVWSPELLVVYNDVTEGWKHMDFTQINKSYSQYRASAQATVQKEQFDSILYAVQAANQGGLSGEQILKQLQGIADLGEGKKTVLQVVEQMLRPSLDKS
jgi:hypothetical protein